MLTNGFQDPEKKQQKNSIQTVADYKLKYAKHKKRISKY